MDFLDTAPGIIGMLYLIGAFLFIGKTKMITALLEAKSFFFVCLMIAAVPLWPLAWWFFELGQKQNEPQKPESSSPVAEDQTARPASHWVA